MICRSLFGNQESIIKLEAFAVLQFYILKYLTDMGKVCIHSFSQSSTWCLFRITQFFQSFDLAPAIGKHISIEATNVFV